VKVTLAAAKKAKVLDQTTVEFGIPLFSHIHMAGSVISVMTLAAAVSQILLGTLPPLGTMMIFGALLCVFAVAAPGVPGGTLMASLGIVTAILGFDETAIALMLTIFAVQDSFGTACNIASDGPMMMILSKRAEKGRG